MNRDPIFGSRVKVIVVNGEANELLMRDYPEHPRPSRYIDQLLEKEVENNMIPEVRLYHFTRDLYDDGIDPVIPVVKVGDNEIVVDGIGLFKGDQYKTKIDPMDARVFFFMRGDFTEGALHFDVEDPELDKKAQLLFSSIENDKKVRVDSSDLNHIKVYLELNIRGSMLEYNGTINVVDPNGLRKIEQIIENQVRTKAEELLQVMQEYEVDSAGIGSYVRNSMSYEEWKGLDWHDVFANIDIEVSVTAAIKDAGFFKFREDE